MCGGNFGIFQGLLLLSMTLLAPLFLLDASAQTLGGTINVMVKNDGGDRVAPEVLSLKVYKNLEKAPFLEIPALTSNPYGISSLPTGNNYRIEVYMNSMYGDVGYVKLDKPVEDVEISVRNAGGIKLDVYYNDGQTPLANVKVQLKSHDGKIWGYTETDSSGQTTRTWTHPTLRQGDYYFAEILLSPEIKYTSQPISILQGIAQDLKMVTNWPTIVDNLITVEVYNSTKNKVMRSDGEFVVQLYDGKKNKISESKVTDKGLAHFSNLKVDTYALHVKKKTASGLETVASKKVTITDSTGTIPIYIHNPELNSDNLNCNCVAFRLDDVQDYYLSPAQIEVFSVFEKKNAPLTIGVIGGLIGSDADLVNKIKSNLSGKNVTLELANHSWNNRVMTSLTKQEQAKFISDTDKKIRDLFHIKPSVFIPPENKFNDDTLSVVRALNYTHISYAAISAEPPTFTKSSFYHFPMVPYTAHLDTASGYWQPAPNDEIFEKIEDSLFDYGYAVVMMHPYEFSNYEGGFYRNVANSTKIHELEALIDRIRTEDIKIVSIGQIQDYENPGPLPGIVQEQKQAEPQPAPHCNCVAFRLDNVQDFWLNDVQNAIIGTFDKERAPLTATVIGKFIGDDPKAVGAIKESLNKTSRLTLANRGWEYVDHTKVDRERQATSILQTNEKLAKLFGAEASIFSPPYDAFNKDTLDAMRQTGMAYLSAAISTDRPPYQNSELQHVPSTVSFADATSDDPFMNGTTAQKALKKIQNSASQHGFALVSLQVPDLAVKQGEFQNKVDEGKLELLRSLISDIRSSGMSIVPVDRIPILLDDDSVVVPEWIKSNAGWWAEGKITDSDFTKGLEYLIEQKVLKIPPTQSSSSQSQKIPGWIKSNAGWWAEGKISDSDFVKGIQYLIENGIVAV